MVPVYIAICIAAALLALVVNLSTPKPNCSIEHVRQLARVLVFGASLASAVRASKTDSVTSESVVLIIGVMFLLAAQARLEFQRQQREQRKLRKTVSTTRGAS